MALPLLAAVPVFSTVIRKDYGSFTCLIRCSHRDFYRVVCIHVATVPEEILLAEDTFKGFSQGSRFVFCAVFQSDHVLHEWDIVKGARGECGATKALEAMYTTLNIPVLDT